VQGNGVNLKGPVLLTSDTIRMVLGDWGINLFFVTCYLFFVTCYLFLTFI
jgi:hypothetical protein